MAFVSALLLNLAASATANEQIPVICAEVLVKIAPCLGFLAAPPINDSSIPSSACCTVVSTYTAIGGVRASGNGVRGAACLCILFRRHRLLGFPVVATHVPLLFSLCRSSSDEAEFRSLCNGLRSSPPPADRTAVSPSSSPPTPSISSPGEIVYTSGATRIFERSIFLRFYRRLLSVILNLEE
ncbi:bifunctional inhibitor/lipid-transfer protein/seed storage 2S albumin superfamily protein [Wolffia australiana]